MRAENFAKSPSFSISVFVHISAVERSGLTGLADDQKVSYELEEGRDGRQMAGDLKSL